MYKDHGSFHMAMTEKDKNILKHKEDRKSLKTRFLVCAKKHCDNNPEESFTTKTSKNTACGCSLFTHCSFDYCKNKHDFPEVLTA